MITGLRQRRLHGGQPRNLIVFNCIVNFHFTFFKSFQCTLQNRFECLAEEEDLEGRWSSFRQTITDVSLEVLGKRPPAKRQCHLSEATKDLISQRAEAKKRGDCYSEEYGRLRKVAKN